MRLPRPGVLALLICAASHDAVAQAGAQAPSPLPDIDVVGVSPIPGGTVDRSLLPETTQILTPQQIDRTGVPSLTGALLENVPSAVVNDTSGTPFQPDILFRGFIASPVAGTPEGLAVYVDGARFNEPFGDTVNWDLIPAIAIASVNVEASNPLFGLNALGGSVDVKLKDGFSYDGADLTAYGGSYDRGAGILQYGHQIGNYAVYFAGQLLSDGGYRQTQATQLYQLYADLGWRNDTSELHLSVDASDNTLGNPGASPVQELDANPASIFTAPNEVYNKYVDVNFRGVTSLNAQNSLQGVAYFHNLTQRITNGATEEVAPCDALGTPGYSGDLCNEDSGAPVTTRGGGIVPDFLHGGVYSGLALLGTDSHAYGASAQIVRDDEFAGHANHLVAGGSFDGSDAVFDGQTQLGGFDTSDNFFVGPGVTQDQPSESVSPTRVATVTRDFALIATDRFSITKTLNFDVSGRFNNVEEDLHDKLGTVLNGQHTFNRFNPSAGLTWQITPIVQLYGSYAETTRAPTPQELSCATAANPCSLLSFFVGDPDLKQVVSRTLEIGLRGRLADVAGGRLSWDADFYHTKNHDDLTYEVDVSNVNLAYYTNVGSTLREGVEANLKYDTDKLHATLGYAFTHAVFENSLLLGSGDNPDADANGFIHVRPGDFLPGIPMHRGTITVEYKITPRWTFGGSEIAESGLYRFGDESNLTKKVGGYAILNLDTSYRITDHITVFALANNVLNQRFDTYGTFGPVGDVPFPAVPGGVTDTRTASPGSPIEGYGGVRVSF